MCTLPSLSKEICLGWAGLLMGGVVAAYQVPGISAWYAPYAERWVMGVDPPSFAASRKGTTNATPDP